MGHLRILGSADRQYLMLDGRPVCIFAHAPTPLGRIPVKVLQRRRAHLRSVFVQNDLEAIGSCECLENLFWPSPIITTGEDAVGIKNAEASTINSML